MVCINWSRIGIALRMTLSKAQTMPPRLDFCVSIALLPLHWLYSSALHEQKITSVPSAHRSSQCLVYLERVTLVFLEAPAKVLLCLIDLDWHTRLVGRRMGSSDWD